MSLTLTVSYKIVTMVLHKEFINFVTIASYSYSYTINLLTVKLFFSQRCHEMASLSEICARSFSSSKLHYLN